MTLPTIDMRPPAMLKWKEPCEHVAPIYINDKFIHVKLQTPGL